MKNNQNIVTFPPWYGEFGWEVMSWIPYIRYRSRGYDWVRVSSFPEMEPLYRDFADEFISNNAAGRSLKYPKKYRVNIGHVMYGDASRAMMCPDVLIHARGIRRKANINYKYWSELCGLLKGLGVTIAWIGTKADYYHPTGYDLRGLPLDKLCDVIAASRVVIGVSSGIMHLAASCGTDLVVWGDGRTYFSETLEKRYKITWNPHNVKVWWLTAADWQPEPEKIIENVRKGLGK